MKEKITVTSGIAQKICKKYDLGKIKDFTLMSEGENINFLISTTEGKYLAKIFIQEDSESENIVYYEQSLFEYLRKNDFSLIPEILKTADKQSFIKISGRICALYSFIEGTNKFIKENAFVKQIAHALGTYHSIVKNYKPDFCGSKYSFTPRILYRILFKETELDYMGDKEFADMIRKEFKNIYNLKISGLPSGTLHGDVDPQNFIFEKGILKGMIDFGDSFYGALLIDICRGIYELCFDSGTKFDMIKMQVFINAYETGRKLSIAEKQQLNDYIGFASCWKITDGLKSKKSISWLKIRLDTLNQFKCEYLNKL